MTDDEKVIALSEHKKLIEDLSLQRRNILISLKDIEGPIPLKTTQLLKRLADKIYKLNCTDPLAENPVKPKKEIEDLPKLDRSAKRKYSREEKNDRAYAMSTKSARTIHHQNKNFPNIGWYND